LSPDYPGLSPETGKLLTVGARNYKGVSKFRVFVSQLTDSDIEGAGGRGFPLGSLYGTKSPLKLNKNYLEELACSLFCGLLIIL